MESPSNSPQPKEQSENNVDVTERQSTDSAAPTLPAHLRPLLLFAVIASGVFLVLYTMLQLFSTPAVPDQSPAGTSAENPAPEFVSDPETLGTPQGYLYFSGTPVSTATATAATKNVYQLDLSTGEIEPFFDSAGAVYGFNVIDDQTIAYLAHSDATAAGDDYQPFLYNLKSNEASPVSGPLGWNELDLVVSPNGRYIVYAQRDSQATDQDELLAIDNWRTVVIDQLKATQYVLEAAAQPQWVRGHGYDGVVYIKSDGIYYFDPDVDTSTQLAAGGLETIVQVAASPVGNSLVVSVPSQRQVGMLSLEEGAQTPQALISDSSALRHSPLFIDDDSFAIVRVAEADTVPPPPPVIEVYSLATGKVMETYKIPGFAASEIVLNEWYSTNLASE